MLGKKDRGEERVYYRKVGDLVRSVLIPSPGSILDEAIASQYQAPSTSRLIMRSPGSTVRRHYCLRPLEYLAWFLQMILTYS